jgi:Flp pilus assembly protein TadG
MLSLVVRRTLFRSLRRRNDGRPRGWSQRGAAAVEFALILPVMLSVVFGTMEYGWVFYQQFNLASAVRDGLRQGVTISQTVTPDPRETARQKTLADLQAQGIAPSSVTVTAAYGGATPTKTMTLTVSMTYQKLIGFVPTPARLQYAMTMMLELQ